MQLTLRLEDIQLKEESENWFEHPEYVSRLRDVIRKSPVGPFTCLYRFKNDKLLQLDSIDQLFELIQQYGKDTYVLQDVASDVPGKRFYIAINDMGFSFVYSIYQAELPLQPLIDSFVDFTVAVYEAFKVDHFIGHRLAIEISDVKGYEPDLDKLNDYWEGSRLVDFLSREYHKEFENGRSEDWDIFSGSKFPRGVNKIMKNDLLIIKWANDPVNVEEIAKGLQFRDAWISENIKPVS